MGPGEMRVNLHNAKTFDRQRVARSVLVVAEVAGRELGSGGAGYRQAWRGFPCKQKFVSSSFKLLLGHNTPASTCNEMNKAVNWTSNVHCLFSCDAPVVEWQKVEQ